MFTLGALCAHDAWRAGGPWPGRFGGAFVYAVLFEWAVSSTAAGGFAYGEFLVHGPGGAPLWVPVGWACLCFCAMRTSDRWGTEPRWAVAVDATLVAAVGWALDPVAVALEWWGWSASEGVHLFGAPAGNYLAWLLVGAGWSAAVRSLEPKLGRLAPLLAIPVALLLVAVLSAGANAVGAFAVLVVVESSVVLATLYAWRRARATTRPSPIVRAVSAVTVLGLLIVMAIEGAPHELWLLVPLVGVGAALPHNSS